MSETVYLFIDNAYLRNVYKDLFKPIFGDYPVDYGTIQAGFGARRVFVYDCVDDTQRPGESEADCKARVQQEEEYLDAIDRVEGVHVVKGYITPGKRRQQKEVDVALAVDMLTHSFSRNMTKAVLLAGDRDFKPVVESLVRLGTYVQLAYEPKSGSRALARAADAEMEINLTDLCSWIKLEEGQSRDDHFPGVFGYGNVDSDPVLHMSPSKMLGRGVIGPAKRAFSFYDTINGRYAAVRVGPREYRVYKFSEEAKLLAYLQKIHGEIVWQET